jgi:hypothetical protein
VGYKIKIFILELCDIHTDDFKSFSKATLH